MPAIKAASGKLKSFADLLNNPLAAVSIPAILAPEELRP